MQARKYLLLPIAGIILFVMLYIIAGSMYPGGSQADPASVGFSWRDNYWCNLLNRHAINGEMNRARPVAAAAMYILSLSLLFFWIMISLLAGEDKRLTRILAYSAGICFLLICSLATVDAHDLIINLASLAGLTATICTMIVLRRLGWMKLFIAGVCNILLVGFNNYVYYTKGLLIYLPVVQKISFLVYLIWISLITIRIFRNAPGALKETEI